MYAIAQREGLGMDKAVEICKDRMSRYGVTPNVSFNYDQHQIGILGAYQVLLN